MNLQMVLDKMDQIIKPGFVNARMPEKMRVKVTLPDTPGGALVTDWLPVLCPRASGDMQYDLPDIGDQVLCLFLPYGLEQGFVIGSMYGKQVPPVQNPDKWHRQFRDGTTLEYDRAAHKLTAHVKGACDVTATGAVTMKSDGPLTLEAPTVYVRGTLINTAKDGSPGKAVFSGGVEVLDGGIHVATGDVVAAGVSLVSHTTEGVEPGDGTSSHPSGGSPVSPGTSAAAGVGMSEAVQLVVLEQLASDVHNRGSVYDKTIICLPQILAAMSEREKEKANKAQDEAEKQDHLNTWQGIIYLREMLIKWLSGDANKVAAEAPSPVWVDWDWAMQNFKVRSDYTDFTNKDLQEGTIYSPLAIHKIAQKLCDSGKLDPEKAPFRYDFIDIEGKDWNKWEDWYYTLRKTGSTSEDIISPSGLYIAMGDFSLRALADVSVEYLENNQWRITLNRVGVFIHDIFNFADTAIPNFIEGEIPYLGFWSCPELDGMKKIGSSDNGYYGLNNLDFQKFREFFIRGANFLVLSRPHIVENSKVVSYVYTCKK